MENSNYQAIKSVNQIRKVIENKGFKDLIPNEDQLKRMDCTIQMWNKWVAGKRDPHLYQIQSISNFLGCALEDLILKN